MVDSFEPFRYNSIEDINASLNKLGIQLPISDDVEVLKENIHINNQTVQNRLSIQPMEGFDADLDGGPTDLTYRRYLRYAEGGAGLIWFEATAITKETRSNSHQLLLSEANVDKFRDLVNKTRVKCNTTLKKLGFKKECILVLQLNHSGRYSTKEGEKYPIRAFEYKELDDALEINQNVGKIITDGELKLLEDVWIKKALLAKEAGFDAVDIKACHGYLISELLASRTRSDSVYGGESLENRSRFLINIFSKLKKELYPSDEFTLTTRFGVYDGNPYPLGFGVSSNSNNETPIPDIREPLEVILKLYKLGLRLINISAGNPHFIPQITRPFDIPVKGGSKPTEHPLLGVKRLIDLCYQVKRNVPKDLMIIGSGFSYLRQFAAYLAAGAIKENFADLCGFGRMAIANPNFPTQIFKNGIIDKNKSCVACSKCSQLMKEGRNSGCVIRDPYYKGTV
jgi:2,4-dienoyl-CoA reductase-like NADH-dependent reductase (Old Yellow Enzyme family)